MKISLPEPSPGPPWTCINDLGRQAPSVDVHQVYMKDHVYILRCPSAFIRMSIWTFMNMEVHQLYICPSGHSLTSINFDMNVQFDPCERPSICIKTFTRYTFEVIQLLNTDVHQAILGRPSIFNMVVNYVLRDCPSFH